MKIDCTDMACPQPVLEVKKALEEIKEDGILEVKLNTLSSIENCKRFAINNGYEIRENKLEDGTTILAVIKGYPCDLPQEKSGNFSNKTFFIKSNSIGSGELGKKLMAGFIKTALELPVLPKNIIFVNEGVLLSTKDENKEIIESLKKLEQKGVAIYSCGLCLSAFGMDANDLKAGVVGNAYETLLMLTNSEVVSL